MISSKLLFYLEEDTAGGDITTEAVVPKINTAAYILAKDDGVIAGLKEAADIFEYCGVVCDIKKPDGSPVSKGDIVMELSGPAPAVLKAERTALNIIGRMSGIATKTARIAAIIRAVNPSCLPAGTRKTSPGFREFDKKAVHLGGGDPHRFNLSDAFLIKDNHLAFASIEKAVSSARAYSAYKKIEIEVETPADALRAVEAGADIIMFDNMTPQMVSESLELIKPKREGRNIIIEVSGKITEETAAEYALPGVDRISFGELTHSVRNFDVSLEAKPAIKSVKIQTVRI